MVQRRKAFGRGFIIMLFMGIVMFSVLFGGFRIIESKKISEQQEASEERIEQIECKLVELQMQLNMYAEK